MALQKGNLITGNGALHSRYLNDTLAGLVELLSKEDAQKRVWVSSYFASQRERIVEDIQLCSTLCGPNDKILDLGSAPFLTTGALRKLGYDIVGVDIAPERFSRALATLGLEVKGCNFELERLPYADETFDLVLFSEVFEHLRIDLISTMSEIRRVLKSGGTLLLSTPNLLEVRKTVRLLTARRTLDTFEEYNKLSTIGHMGHVREYTPEDVVDFMARLGFSCTKVIFRGVTPWSLHPKKLLHALIHRLAPSTRKWFMLVLIKT